MSLVSKQEHELSTMPPKKILLLNGANVNLLGVRDPVVYGKETLSVIEASCEALTASKGAELLFFQSNHEGYLLERIHKAFFEGVSAIVINPGAFAHTSAAFRDAFASVEIPFVEMHISNIHKKEEWRNKNFLSDKADAVIVGLGTYGYKAAVEFVLEKYARVDDT
jgi:3-dehydroquinate dehydratase-2